MVDLRTKGSASPSSQEPKPSPSAGVSARRLLLCEFVESAMLSGKTGAGGGAGGAGGAPRGGGRGSDGGWRRNRVVGLGTLFCLYDMSHVLFL